MLLNMLYTYDGDLFGKMEKNLSWLWCKQNILCSSVVMYVLVIQLAEPADHEL